MVVLSAPVPFRRWAGVALLLVGVAACSGAPTPEDPTSAADSVAATSTSASSEPSASTGPERDAFAEANLSYRKRKAECLREMGFDVTLAEGDPAFPMVIKHGAGGPDEVRQAKRECEERLGEPPTAELADDLELGKFYDLQVEAYDCLVDQGLSPVPPSTREAFVATYYTGESWYAHMPLVPEGSPMPDDVCPQPMLADIEW